MKKLRIIAILGIAMLSFNSMNAQSDAATTNKETINSSDKQPEKIVYKNIDYYIIDGVWYAKIKKRFVLRTAPKGAKLKNLPKGGENVVMAGVKYYKLNGVFYKKSKGGGYEVARP
ncbi:hypothetical protein JBL43_14535 [Aureibaculum sp. A20]|uniref:Surface layer protein A domain-containing protein n=1 Tax=Aureibaculum flavum TaxID=2795986 RepID=A0ABS0WU24_9FLAO|nr:DUF6515 family protein [Aureibaculum flavum]MBJ2175466.1 hypothetical protein [Aureibaculum flavum]